MVNYCTWDGNNRQVPNGNTIVLSKGNLQAVQGSASNQSVKSTFPFHGKQYIEVKMISNSSSVGSRQSIGIIEYNANLENGYTPSSNSTFSGIVFPRLTPYSDGSAGSVGADLTDGQTICLAYSEDDQKWWYRVNDGAWIGGGDPTVPGSTPSGTFTSGKTYLWINHLYDSSDENITDFGSNSYAYTPPTDYLPVNAANLPAPTITNPSLHFSGIGYTGNGTAQRIGNFIPFTDSNTVSNSGRLDTGSSQYLSKTFAGAGNNKIGSISFWIKRGKLGTDQQLFHCGTGGSSQIRFSANNTLYFRLEDSSGSAVGQRTSTRTFEMTDTWYHMLFTFDCAAGTMQIYVDGLELTALTSSGPSDTASTFSSAAAHYIGSTHAPADYLDGYLAEFVYVDGTKLTPSSFGQTDTATNRWIPKAITGLTFGTNGFYFNMASGTALGNDVSGNNNDWAMNGMDTTNGSNQMYDTPTQNFPTYSRNSVFSDSSLTEGNTTIKLVTTNADNCSILQAAIPSSGVYYWEVLALNTGSMYFGVSYNDNTLSTSAFNQSWLIGMNGSRYDPSTGSGTALFTALSAGDMIGMAYNGNLGALYYSINGAWMDGNGSLSNSATVKAEIEAGTATTNAIFINVFQPTLVGTNNITATSVLMPAVLDDSNNTMPTLGSTTNTGSWVYLDSGALTFNVTAGGFFQSTTIPSNAVSLSQDNLLANAAGITAFNLIKSTSAITNNLISDRLTGPNQFMTTKGPTATQQDSNTGVVNSFLQDGVQIGEYADINTDNALYNSFNWAGGGAGATSSPAGTIPSTVTVNTTAGFSVITYTGSGVAGTIGHGLGVAPACIWVAMRSNAYGWAIYHQELGNTSFIRPFKPDAVVTGSTFWNSTTPIPDTFSVGTDATVNENNSTFVAFAFTEIAGYSKFGTYIGNGNSEGPYIYCGFRPELVIYKNSSAASTDWVQSSTVDYPAGNPVTNAVFPNLASAASSREMRIYANGFKITNSNSDANGDGNTIIFMAWAKYPFGGDGVTQGTAR